MSDNLTETSKTTEKQRPVDWRVITPGEFVSLLKYTLTETFTQKASVVVAGIDIALADRPEWADKKTERLQRAKKAGMDIAEEVTLWNIATERVLSEKPLPIMHHVNGVFRIDIDALKTIPPEEINR